MDLSQNIKEACWVLTEQPLFATAAERFLILNEIKSEYKDLPQPKRFAKFMTILLDRVSVPLQPYDLVAGRCVIRELSETEEKEFQNFIHHPDYPRKAVMFSSGHCTYSWEKVVSLGLSGLRCNAAEHLKRETDEEKRVFWESMVEVYDAISRYLLRYALAAKEQGMEDLAEVLTKTATAPPDSFRVALQLLWTITFINCAYITENPTLTVGRLDQILYPFYSKDVESGALTKEDAAALITDYYCKHNLMMGRGEHQLGDEYNSTTFKRIVNFDAPQYLLLAGTDAKGHPVVNELTQMFADCIRPQFKNPVIVVRYFKDLDTCYPNLWLTLTQKSLQSAALMYYNDDNILAAYRRMGIPEEDAVRYEHFGCNWPTLGDHCAWIQNSPAAFKYGTATKDELRLLETPVRRMHAKHSWPEDLVETLRQLSCRAVISIEDIYDGFFQKVADFADQKLKRFSLEIRVRQRRLSGVMNYTDCFTEHAFESAECFNASAKYHMGMQSFHMFGTVVDCFTTVDQLVIRDQKLTLSQLLQAVDANFEGYAHILALCRSVEKYGSGSALSNAHAHRIARTYSDILMEKSRPYLKEMGLYLAPTLQSDTWHLKTGQLYGATPDGRPAHTSFSQNLRPANGSCINGIAAMLGSVLSVPSDAILSGALNLDIDPADFKGEAGHKLFAAMMGSYFNRGGLHAQVSAAGREELLDAKLHPHNHRDLRVRVTGYSGVFVDLPERLQDDVIERFK